MTIIEMFRTKSVEEIADEFVKEYRRPGTPETTPLSFAFDPNIIDEFSECPEECENYEFDDYYEGMHCFLQDGEECPFHINKDDALKRSFIEWLNAEIKEGIKNAK